MSQFDSFIESSFAGALDVIGMTEFTISGEGYCGVINEHAAVRIYDAEGKSYDYTATIVAPVDQFDGISTATLEKHFAGAKVECHGRAYKVESCSSDSISLTFTLSTQSEKR